MNKSLLSIVVAIVVSVSTIVSCQKTDTTVTPSSATVSALTCGSTTLSTTAASGTACTGTATVPCNGGNGVAYAAGGVLASTGMTGLNATLHVVLGPGKDGQFPATKVGLKVGNLDAAKQALVLNAIKLYVNALDAATAATVLAKHTADLPNTYIAYSGTGTMTPQGDYVRIDGPGVWIEYNSQGGVIVRNTPHPHSVWRDHTTDYGGN